MAFPDCETADVLYIYDVYTGKSHLEVPRVRLDPTSLKVEKTLATGRFDRDVMCVTDKSAMPGG